MARAARLSPLPRGGFAPPQQGGSQSFHAANAAGPQAPGHHIVHVQKNNAASTTAFSSLGLSAPTMRAINEVMEIHARHRRSGPDAALHPQRPRHSGARQDGIWKDGGFPPPLH